ncbi:MAG: hypothetical protein RL226_1463 [Bacteroidota bacterium]
MANYLIIGGSSGIGQSTAQQLSQLGHNVWASYNQHVKTSNGNIQYFPWNHADVPDLSELPEQLDGLVYCPGTILLKPFHRISDEQFMDDYRVQTIGAIKWIQAVLPHLKRSQQASIVLYSTLAVQTGLPFHALVSASKGSIEGLTRALAAEFSPSIRVNAIAPSLTDTPLAAGLLNSPEKRQANAQRHPLKRLGTTEDMAEMTVFLLEKASWMTGQVLHLDGGLSNLKV